jgi:hypothetical protein
MMDFFNYDRMSRMTMLVSILLFTGVPFSAAQSAKNDGPGITPDSWLYSLDRAWDEMTLAMTFDKTARAEKGIALANERLLELQAMTEQGKDLYALTAEQGYDDAMQKAEQAIMNLENDGSSEAARQAITKISIIQNKTEDHYTRVSDIKEGIIAMMKAKNMSADKIAHIQQVFSKIEDKAQEVETATSSKKYNAEIRFKALSGKSDSEIQSIVQQIEQDTGLKAGRRERSLQEIAQAEKTLQVLRLMANSQRVNQGNNTENNTNSTNLTLIEDNINQLESKIAMAKDLGNSGRDLVANDIAEESRHFGNEISVIATQLEDAKKNGNFDEVFAQLKDQIAQRRAEFMNRVSEQTRGTGEDFQDDNNDNIFTEKSAGNATNSTLRREHDQEQEREQENLREQERHGGNFTNETSNRTWRKESDGSPREGGEKGKEGNFSIRTGPGPSSEPRDASSDSQKREESRQTSQGDGSSSSHSSEGEEDKKD